MDGNNQRREHYRLQYPLQARPRLMVGNTEYPLTEVSEEGGRLMARSVEASIFDAGPRVILRFHSDIQVATQATFLRVDGQEMVLKFFPAIPQSTILAEQRWLLSRYPKEQLSNRGS